MKNSLRAIWGFCFLFLVSLSFQATGHAGNLVATWGDTEAGGGMLPRGMSDIKAIAGGGGFSLALRSDGTVLAWGTTNEPRHADALIVPLGLTNVIAISAGDNHALALKANGTVTAWGHNLFGATNVPVGLSNVTAITAWSANSVALKSDGTLVVWGSTFPTNTLSGIKNAKAISGGLILREDGTVLVLGQSIPVSGLSGVTAIAAGGNFNLALRANGTVAAWGHNTEGQTNVPLHLTNVIAISAGFAHGMALNADGKVAVWGRNIFGQTNTPSELANITAIAAGANHNLALVSAGPIQITQDPESRIGLLRSNVTFTINVTGQQPRQYQWLFNGVPLTNHSRITGATSASLTIHDLQFADAGNYSVAVGNALSSVISSNAVLTVFEAPFITNHPSSQTGRVGANISISVAASGTAPLRYQWSFNGTHLPGRTNNSITLSNVQTNDSGIYSLLVTNAYGQAQTKFQLTVTNSAPYFVKQPFVRQTNQTIVTNPVVSLGDSVLFEVEANGSKPLSYQWRFNGANIPNATNTTLALSNLQYGQTGFYTVGVSNAFGETNSVKAFLNVAQLRVWGTAFEGSTNMPAGLTNVIAVAAGDAHIVALKDDGTVRVWPANATFINASVTNVPVSATNVIAIAAGSDQTLALRSNGTVVTWGYYGSNSVPFGLSNVISISASSSRGFAVKADGTAVAWGSQPLLPAGLSNIVKISSSTSHHLALKRDGSVIAWANAGVPAYLTNLSGLSNVIDIAAGRGGNLALRKDGTVWVSPGSRILLATNLFNRVAVAAGNFASMALKDDGAVATSGSFGKDKLPLLSNVTAIAIGGNSDFGVTLFGNGAPALTLNPYSQIVSKGNAVQLHARAAGVQPMSYQWQVENQDIPGATNASLLITNIQGKHMGNYRMLVSNALGSTVSATARLTMPFNTNLQAALNATNLVWSAGLTNINPTNATWFAQIQETHDGEVAAQSGAISHNQQIPLSTSVSGPGTLTFWWKVSSEAGYDFLRFNIDSEPQSRASISGETGWEHKTFSIPAGSHILRWTYIKDGTVSSGRDAGFVDEVVFSRPVPKIIRHPFDQTVSVGANVTIPAVAESSTQMSYQWLKNGTNLVGATAQYLILTNVASSDAGLYAIKVSNLYGSVTSSYAILTVVVPPQLNSFQVLPDGSTRFLLGDVVSGTSVAENMEAFEVQASTNVKDWITLPITPILTNGSLRFDDTNSKNLPMRFYRIVEH